MTTQDTATTKDNSSATLGAGVWQPIETAPKDGTRILCILSGNHPAGHAFCPAVVEWHVTQWRDPDGDFYEPSDAFTHWMPLPDAPAHPSPAI